MFVALWRKLTNISIIKAGPDNQSPVTGGELLTLQISFWSHLTVTWPWIYILPKISQVPLVNNHQKWRDDFEPLFKLQGALLCPLSSDLNCFLLYILSISFHIPIPISSSIILLYYLSSEKMTGKGCYVCSEIHTEPCPNRS